MSTTHTITAEDLWKLPADGFRHELVRGELRTMSPAGSEHGAIIVNLTVPLAHYVKANHLGAVFGAETGFHISRQPDTVRAPDLAFVRREQIPQTGIPRAYWPGPPDLAVEVISPSDTVFEVEEKVEEWLAAGTGMVWVVNPRRRSVAVYRTPGDTLTLSETDELDGQEIIPGFRCRVGDLFPL